MKLNWGTGIVLTLTSFAGLMTFMVYQSLQQNFDLVSEDYYREELKFQEVIDGKKEALRLRDKASLELLETGFLLQLPKDLEGKEKTCSIWMYHELSAKNDFHFQMDSTVENSFTLPFQKMDTGKWVAKVELQCAGKAYYFEPEIRL
jgi:hypothetical protein